MSSLIRSISPLAAACSVCAGHPCFAAAPVSTARAEISEEIARSRALYRAAQAAFEDGQYAIAQEKLLQAWAIRKTFDVAAALTQVDLELKQYRDAARHAEYCLRVFAPAESDATLESVLDMYAEAKKHVGLLRIHAKPVGAMISVDGDSVGTAPLASPVFLEPGDHSIQVRLARATDGRKMHIDAGSEYEVSIELPQATTGTKNASSEDASSNSAVPNQSRLRQEPGPQRYGPVYWSLGIGGTVTIAAVATGLLYHAHATSKQDAAAAIQASTPTCINVSSPDCDHLSNLVSERNQANTNAQIMLGVAGVAAIGTGIVTYLVWPASTSHDAVKTGGWLTPSAAGLGLGGQF